MNDSELDRLVEVLSAEGELDSSGRFTLDLLAARDRFSRFLVDEPRLYLARLIRAAVLAGASEVQLHSTRGEVVMIVPEPLCARSELSRLLEPLEGAHTDPVKQLALGLLQVLRLEPETVELTLADAEGAVRLRFQGGKSYVDHLPPDLLQGTYIRVAFPGLNLLDLIQAPAEFQLVQERFRFAPIPIRVGNKLVQVDWSRSRSPRSSQLVIDEHDVVWIARAWIFPGSFWAQHQALQMRFSGRGVGMLDQTQAAVVLHQGDIHCGAALGLFCGPKYGGKVLLLHAGEIIETVSGRGLLDPQVEAVVDCTDLNLDISGQKLVEDEAYQQRLTRVKAYNQQMFEYLARRYPKVQNRDYLSSLLYDRVFHGWQRF